MAQRAFPRLDSSAAAWPIAAWLAGWWHLLHFAALMIVVALSPTSWKNPTRMAAAGQICLAAWRVLPGFALLSALFSMVLIQVVTVTATSYGLSTYALEMVVRVLVLELLPLSAALFVAVRSGVAINAELARLHDGGALVILQRRGGDPLRQVLVPRVAGGAVAVVALTAVSGGIALFLSYLSLYGISPWGLIEFTRIVGHVFEPATLFGFLLKTALFALAVATVPVASAMEPVRSAPILEPALRGMVRLLLVLVMIEAASLTAHYA